MFRCLWSSPFDCPFLRPLIVPSSASSFAMAQVPIPDSHVQRELGGLDEKPPSDEERKNAARAIVRFKGAKGAAEEESPIDVTEDWVRLYVALRRASGSSAVRFSAAHLRRWRARVSQSTTVKRKVFITIPNLW